MIKKNVIGVYSDVDQNGHGKRVLIKLENSHDILIDRFWAKAYHSEDAYDFDCSNFKEYSQFDQGVLLLNIKTIEGVATFMEFSNGIYLSIFEEVEDIERSAFYYRIDLISPKNNNIDFSTFIEDFNDAETIKIDPPSKFY